MDPLILWSLIFPYFFRQAESSWLNDRGQEDLRKGEIEGPSLILSDFFISLLVDPFNWQPRSEEDQRNRGDPADPEVFDMLLLFSRRAGSSWLNDLGKEDERRGGMEVGPAPHVETRPLLQCQLSLNCIRYCGRFILLQTQFCQVFDIC